MFSVATATLRRTATKSPNAYSFVCRSMSSLPETMKVRQLVCKVNSFSQGTVTMLLPVVVSRQCVPLPLAHEKITQCLVSVNVVVI